MKICFFVYLFGCIQCFSQKNYISFCRNLCLQENYKDVSLYTTQLISTSDSISIDSHTRDTLKFYDAKAKLKLNPNDSTVLNIHTQHQNNGLLMLKVYYLINKTKFKDVDSLLTTKNTLDSSNLHLVYVYEKLLQHQFVDAENRLNQLNTTAYSFAYQILLHDIHLIIEKQKSFKKKSPTKSALLSAVFPGYGKRYVGYKGEAVSSLLNNSILALVFAEAIWRKGIKSPYTVGVGMVFSTFYISNIVGSYYAAKRLNVQHERNIDEEIRKNISRWADTIVE